MKLRQGESPGVLAVSGSLDIEAANELRQALLVCLSQQSEIMLDLSSVDKCDVTGLQILLAGQKSALAAGKPFRILGVPPAVTEPAAALGLSLEGLV
jgi:anti-anti-sigma factor